METNIAASRKPTFFSLLAALLIVMIGGGLVGMVVGVVGSFIYLAIVFPIGMGLAGSTIAGRAAQAARVRKTGQVTLVFLLTALVLYGSFHYSRYVMFQARIWLALTSPDTAQAGGAQVSAAGAKAFANYVLEEETGHPGFAGYMLYRAKTGNSIGRFYRENRLNLTGILAWLYWAAELGLILWIMHGGVKDHQRIPVCETCGRRLGREKHLGGTVPANEQVLLELLEHHNVTGLGTRGVVLSDITRATLPPQDSTLFLQQLRFEVE